MSRRLIETGFPLRAVSEASVREKYIRLGHISTLHIWWARRPLAASRATALAALLPDDPARRDEFITLIKQLAPWEEALNQPLLEKARALIREAHDGRAPKVLDPFAGGGSIPLEALRLGCETYALDYNPVAVLLNKAVLEYPQKFGRPVRVRAPGRLGGHKEVSPLLEEVKRWGEWVLEEARKELAPYYPEDPDGSVPVGYIWARTLPCQNPACGAEIPLMRQFWLARKKTKQVALRPRVDRAAKRVEFDIVEEHAIDHDPGEGTVSGARVRCPVCGNTGDAKTTRRLFRLGWSGQRLVAVVLSHPRRRGKAYRLPTEEDLAVYRAAENALEARRQEMRATWGMDPVPDEPLSAQRPSPNARGLSAVGPYGISSWGDLFAGRQRLALVVLADKVRQAHARMLEGEAPSAYARALATYLALGLDVVSVSCNTLCRWENTRELIADPFSRQALSMLWDFIELNPIGGGSGSWKSVLRYGLRVLPNVIAAASSKSPSTIVLQGDATSLPWTDCSFDCVLTDPPYYDNVPYSDLADFFYVWLKRTVGHLYPELFATPLTPKSSEIVWHKRHGGSYDAARLFYEERLTQAFAQIRRVLTQDGTAVVVFAHKATSAWETVIDALLHAGLYMTASWPVHTEMGARVNAHETASLASSIYMVCRARVSDEVGEYARVREEIRARIQERLTHFWQEGIRGADFFMSAIGPAVEVFGRYARVEKLSGERVEVPELLDYVQQVVAEFALERVLQSPDLGGVDGETRFYLLWRWTYNHARVPFDEASKLARAVGAEISDLWSHSGFVQKSKEYVRVLGPRERARDERFMERERYYTLVDALQKASLLWEQNRREALGEHLARYAAGDTFWRVAQAISDVLPEGDREKQLLQGLLNVRGRTGSSPAGSEPHPPRQGELDMGGE